MSQLNAMPFKVCVSIDSCIVARIDEVCNMLFWITCPTKLVAFGRLVTVRQMKSVDPLRVGFGVEMTLW